MPTCWIIAGPNGAGKTTFALEWMADGRHHIDEGRLRHLEQKIRELGGE